MSNSNCYECHKATDPNNILALTNNHYLKASPKLISHSFNAAYDCQGPKPPASLSTKGAPKLSHTFNGAQAAKEPAKSSGKGVLESGKEYEASSEVWLSYRQVTKDGYEFSNCQDPYEQGVVSCLAMAPISVIAFCFGQADKRLLSISESLNSHTEHNQDNSDFSLNTEQVYDFKNGLLPEQTTEQCYQQFIELSRSKGRMAAIGLAPVAIKFCKALAKQRDLNQIQIS